MGKKILIVDDEKDLVQLYKIVFNMAGYNVSGTTSGMEALTLIPEENPDLILLDVMMPEINGIEVCRRVRDMMDNKQPFILMYTANDSLENQQKSKAAGADTLISKQIPIEKLTETINTFLQSELAEADPAPKG